MKRIYDLYNRPISAHITARRNNRIQECGRMIGTRCYDSIDDDDSDRRPYVQLRKKIEKAFRSAVVDLDSLLLEVQK